MVNFKLNSKAYSIAEDWQELSDKQLLAVVPFKFADSTAFEVRVQLMLTLVPGLKRKLIMKLSESDFYELAELSAWVWEKQISSVSLEHFDHNGERYLLPKAQLDDTVAVEFAMADLFLKEFVASSDPKYLDLLVATICRPSKSAEEINHTSWDGVERERYNGAIAERRAKAFAMMPLEMKVIVLHHFVEQKKFVYENYNIFSNGSGGGGEGEGFDIGWVALLYDLAEQGTFGDFEKVSFTNINTLCLYLHSKKQQGNDQ